MGQEEGRRDRFFLNSPLPGACIVFSRFIVFFPFSCENIEVKIRKSRLNPQNRGPKVKGRAWQHSGGVQRVTHSMEREHFYSCAKMIGILRRRSTSESYTCLRFSINHNISRINRAQIADQSRSNRGSITLKSRPRYRAV